MEVLVENGILALTQRCILEHRPKFVKRIACAGHIVGRVQRIDHVAAFGADIRDTVADGRFLNHTLRGMQPVEHDDLVGPKLLNQALDGCIGKRAEVNETAQAFHHFRAVVNVVGQQKPPRRYRGVVAQTDTIHFV